MSDFLSNLMARSLGTLPAIQPRLPSLYETSRHGGSLGSLFDAGQAAAGGSEQALDQTVEGIISPATPQGNLETSEADLLSHGPARRGSWREARRSPHGRADQSSLHGSSPQMFSIGMQGSHEGSIQPDATENQIATVPHDVRPEFLDVRTHGNQLPPAGRTFDQLSQEVFDGGAGNPHRLIPNGSLTLQPRRTIAQPRVAREEADQGRSSLPRSNPNEPSVHVTIGRVEVRAVFPAPATGRARPTRSRATLSLDDYLKRRDRRQR